MPRNIVYLHCHDAGRFISPYGHALPTPYLQAFAEEATLFRQAHCAGPTCSPSRAGLLFSQSPQETGMMGLAHRGFSLRDPSQHFSAYARANGYETVLAGVQHVFHWDQEKPYDLEIHFEGGHFTLQDVNLATRTAQWIRERAESDTDKPFLLECGFILPHRDFPLAGPGIDDRYIGVPSCLPDTAETRRDMAEYAEATRIMDHAAGIVLQALRDTGRFEDTVILFTTDHGIAFPWMKCNLYDTGTGVSFILHNPDSPVRGQVRDSLVSHLDVVPTFCDLAGLEIPPWARGHSIKPILEGKETEVRKELFSEVTFHAAYEPQRCVRTKKHKLIRRYDPNHTTLVAPNVDGGLSKDLLVENHWREQKKPQLEMYDLILDPAERNNLAADPAYAEVLADLSVHLDNWMQETDDPLLKGPVKPPKGAKLNPVTQASPKDPVTVYE